MRIASLDRRLVIVVADTYIDVADESGGAFGPDPQPVFARWNAFRSWAESVDIAAGRPLDGLRLGAPVPHPPQIFGVGLNYRAHAEEAGLDLPDSPLVFAKLPSSITGPYDAILLPNETVDYEAELVVVIGEVDGAVAAADAWSVVAGLTVGQDISDRALQWSGPTPQFTLGKSRAGFSPIGPVIVTVDELADPAALRVSTAIGDDVLQDGTTSDLIFDIPFLIEHLTSLVRLLPGDLIFTGTPAGVGAARSPQRFLAPGDTLTSTIEHIGQLRNELRRREA